jgi:Fe-S-cluster containining protein
VIYLPEAPVPDKMKNRAFIKMNKRSGEKNKKKPAKAKRFSSSVDENLHPWLPALLDAYYIVDKGIAEAVESKNRKGRELACSKGCSYCCSTHRDIPVYPLELVGISWYVIEKVSGSLREVLRDRLENYSQNSPCPFLIDSICGVHLVRPMACRQFNVFGKPCSAGEDPYHTRREDVLSPVKKHVDQAFFIMLPFYGVEKESDRKGLIEQGAMHKMVRVLQECNWQSLAKKMDKVDAKLKERSHD